MRELLLIAVMLMPAMAFAQSEIEFKNVASDSGLNTVANLSSQVDENTKQILALQANQETILENQDTLDKRVKAFEAKEEAPSTGSSLASYRSVRRASKLSSNMPLRPTFNRMLGFGSPVVSGGGSTGNLPRNPSLGSGFGSPVVSGGGSTGSYVPLTPSAFKPYLGYSTAPLAVAAPLPAPVPPMPVFMPTPVPTPAPMRFVATRPTQATTSQLVQPAVYKTTTLSTDCPGGVCPLPTRSSSARPILGSRLRSRRQGF